MKADLRVAGFEFFVILILILNENMVLLKVKFGGPSKNMVDNFVTFWLQR